MAKSHRRLQTQQSGLLEWISHSKLALIEMLSSHPEHRSLIGLLLVVIERDSGEGRDASMQVCLKEPLCVCGRILQIIRKLLQIHLLLSARLSVGSG